MKSRKVILTIELQSNETTSALKAVVREALNCKGSWETKVLQIQCNVIGKKK